MKKILMVFYLLGFVFFTVIAQNNCNINTSFTSSIPIGKSVNFFADSSYSSYGSYTWNFGDGSFAYGQNTNHTFPSSGTYTVCLTYMQMQPNYPYDSCVVIFCDSVTIAGQECNISTNFTSSATIGKSVNFFADSSSNSYGNYIWNFGDGSFAYGQDVNHTFPSSGTYTVCLTYMQMQPNYPYDTCIAIFCDSVTIAGQECNISTNFTSSATIGKSVNFFADSSSNSYGNYIWNFGDGTSDWGQNVNHTFPSSGTYTVCLTYMRLKPNNPYDTCVAIFCDSITIAGQECNISTNFTSSAPIGKSVNFFADSSSNSYGNYIWNFGDGTSDWGQNVSHTFPSSGTYTVCLTYIQLQPNSPYDTCVAIFCDSVTIAGQECNISTNFTSSATIGKSVNFFADSSSNSYGNYIWNFGDGTSDWGQNVNHTFPSSGTYTVCLTYMQIQPNNPYDTCRAVYCDSIVVKEKIKKHKGSEKPHISLYPMPASDRINFQLSEDDNEVTIEILNNIGNVVKKSDNKNGNHIDIFDLDNGFYILRIITPNNYYLKEFIKN